MFTETVAHIAFPFVLYMIDVIVVRILPSNVIKFTSALHFHGLITEKDAYPMSMNYWHDLSSGPSLPEVVHAVIEVPKGNRNKYEYSKRAGVIKLDRVLYSPVVYPGDYGFIPRTLFEDGDPTDILVMINEPTFPGCVIEARPIGMFKMIDNAEKDYKVLAVPATDPNFDGYTDMQDIPKHFPREVEHFFLTYKQLQGTHVESGGWVGVDEARAEIEASRQRYQAEFSGSSL